MQSQFRASMDWLHTWSGIVCGWLLYFIFLTGSIGYFDTEIDQWMNPALRIGQTQHRQAEYTEMALAQLREHASGADRWFIVLPIDRNDLLPRIFWQSPEKPDGQRLVRAVGGAAFLDPASGQMLDLKHSLGGQFLYRLHYNLHYMPLGVALWIVGLGTLGMLVALVTGLVVHRRIFADFFTFRPGKGARSWLDAHNLLSVTALPFFLMISYSGLIFFAFTYMPLIALAHYGDDAAGRQAFNAEVYEGGDTYPRIGQPASLAPLAPMLDQAAARWGADRVNGIDIRHPGDAGARVLLRPGQDSPLRSGEIMVFDGVGGELLEIRPAEAAGVKAVYHMLLGLHEGLFAEATLRLLYFMSGLAGAGMIATGLVLWTVKRRQRIERHGERAHPGLRLVERLNAGTVIGLPVGIAGYFWANRLLPDTLAERAAWEGHVLFIVWAAMLIHAALRPRQRLWTEQAALAATAYLLLPALNALSTGRHLIASLTEGDTVFAGFDCAMLFIGTCWAAVAYKCRSRTASTGRHVSKQQ
jgi:uncharacterized iron-regulated membrane protein